MIDELTKLKAELQKSKAEFDILSACIIQSLQSLHERMEKVELWISEGIKNLPQKKT